MDFANALVAAAQGRTLWAQTFTSLPAMEQAVLATGAQTEFMKFATEELRRDGPGEIGR
jgi:hypothetical protein